MTIIILKPEVYSTFTLTYKYLSVIDRACIIELFSIALLVRTENKRSIRKPPHCDTRTTAITLNSDGKNVDICIISYSTFLNLVERKKKKKKKSLMFQYKSFALNKTNFCYLFALNKHRKYGQMNVLLPTEFKGKYLCLYKRRGKIWKSLLL